jgi:enoyl-CoA hydratase/carnithine racemase
MRELSELVDLIERDTQLNVVVFDSANPDFFLAHYDGEFRQAAGRLGPRARLAKLEELGLNIESDLERRLG